MRASDVALQLLIMIITARSEPWVQRQKLISPLSTRLINGGETTPRQAALQNKTFFQYNAIQWINENEGLLVFSFCPLFKWVCVRKSVRRTKRQEAAGGGAQGGRSAVGRLPPPSVHVRVFYSLWLVRRAFTLFAHGFFIVDASICNLKTRECTYWFLIKFIFSVGNRSTNRSHNH